MKTWILEIKAKDIFGREDSIRFRSDELVCKALNTIYTDDYTYANFVFDLLENFKDSQVQYLTRCQYLKLKKFLETYHFDIDLNNY